MSFLFENLKPYQAALDVAQEAFRLTRQWPKGHADMVDQLRRASTSISTNLAEGSGRRHLNDRRQFFLVARGSANECVPILTLASSLGLISLKDYSRLKNRLEVIAKLISALISKSEASHINSPVNP